MKLTLLLDLDDTLLNTNLAAYFQALSNHLASQIEPDLMLRALISGMRAMNENEDFSRTLQEVFEAEFFAQVDISPDNLQPALEDFYDNIFPTLSGWTSQIPEAKAFVDWAFSKGYRIAIATDPLLPPKTTHHRLRWAGFDPAQFELISTLDNFHFSKAHAAYYAEVLGRMGWPEGAVLMVGDDMERDILPAKKLGLAAFHADVESTSPLGVEAGVRGSLADLRVWLESAESSDLTPSFKSIDSILGILSASPAAMNGLLHGLDPELWSRKPAEEDWCLTELVCHLRDTELEIHQMQIKLFKEQNVPFIPRPETGVWASERDYLHECGASALTEFNNARRDTLLLLKDIPHAAWQRKARHAIFGPTSFIEVVSFIADHDRMHIQQAFAALKKL